MYKSFHFRPSSQYPLTSSSPSPPFSPALRAVRNSFPVGSSSSCPLPPDLGRWASKQTRIPKSQYMQRKQLPVPLSMASQTVPMQTKFLESGLIMCWFSPSPAGLGELSLDYSPVSVGESTPHCPAFLANVLHPFAPHLHLGGSV